MTVRLDWPSDVVERFSVEARQRGLSLDAYILQAVLEANRSDADTSSEAERRHRREIAASNIRELRKNLTLGPDLTIRDLIEEGRRF